MGVSVVGPGRPPAGGGLAPGAAILWTLLVPGLAHLRLGQPLRALAALATSAGLFFAGAAIVGDTIWHFELFEPMAFLKPLLDRVPIQLLPESPNLGCCIALALLREAPATEQAMYDWQRMIRLPVPHQHLGLFLMGITGVINSLWAADAHWLARAPRATRPSPPLAAFLSWLFPGAGHALAGQRSKGLLLGAAVVAMFALGLWLSNGHGVDRFQRSAWWIPQVLFGSGTLFATLVTAPLEEGPPNRWFDHGVALCAVAGLMNLIVMIDAYTTAEQVGAAKASAPAPEPARGVA